MKNILSEVFLKNLNKIACLFYKAQEVNFVQVLSDSCGFTMFQSKLGRGKSGGVRVIYYWILPKDTILMLLVYPKNEQDNLYSSQLKLLRSLVEKELQ